MSLSSPKSSGRLARAAIALALLGSVSYASAQGRSGPKVELFGGYSYFYPHATISGLLPGGTLPIVSCLCADVRGVGGSATYNVNRWFGLTADASGNWSGAGTSTSNRVGKADFFAFSAGPKFTLHARHFSPFAEALVGEQRLSPALFTPDNAFGVLAGGGLDLPVSRHIAVRLFRADFVYSNHQFGPSATVPATDIRGLRLEAGIVFLFGVHQPNTPPAPAPAPEVPAPAPIIAAVPQPPTLTLSANPSTIMAGDSSTITAVGMSPDNRPLTYSFNANAGRITPGLSTAQLSTVGVNSGSVEVIGTVVDDRGLSATVSVMVALTAAPIAATVTTRPVCSVGFARDMRRPTRVDNEGKACLDEIALDLQRTSDSSLVLVGNAASEESAPHMAAQRAVNTKAYLVAEKGIDATRIALYTGSDSMKVVQTTLVPAGAAFDAHGATPIDERSLRPQPRTSAAHHKAAHPSAN